MRLFVLLGVVSSHYVRKETRVVDDDSVGSLLEETAGETLALNGLEGSAQEAVLGTWAHAREFHSGELTADAVFKELLNFKADLANRRTRYDGSSLIQGGVVNSLDEALTEEKNAMRRVEIAPHIVYSQETVRATNSLLQKAGITATVGEEPVENPPKDVNALEQAEDNLEKTEQEGELTQKDDPADGETVANEEIRPEDLYYHFKSCKEGQSHCPATARFTPPIASYPIEHHQTALQKEQLKVCGEFKKAYDQRKEIIDSAKTAIVAYQANKDLAKLNELKGLLERITEELKPQEDVPSTAQKAQRCQYVIVFGRKGMDGVDGRPGQDGRMGAYGPSGPMGPVGEPGFDGRGGSHFATSSEMYGIGILNFIAVVVIIQKGKKLRVLHGIKDGEVWDVDDHVDHDTDDENLPQVNPEVQQRKKQDIMALAGLDSHPRGMSSDSD